MGRYSTSDDSHVEGMMFIPVGSHFQRPQVSPPTCGCRRFYLHLCVAGLVVSLIVILHVLTDIKDIFVKFHTASDTDGELVVLPEEFVRSMGAYCLDGSPPGYYLRYGNFS